MANTLDVQLLEYGPKNVRVKVIGLLDTSDLNITTFLQPDDVLPFPPRGANILRTFRIDAVHYSISEGLSVLFWWRGIPDQIAVAVAGSQNMDCLESSGGVQNNASSPTGALAVSSRGYITGALTFTCILELVKIGGV